MTRLCPVCGKPAHLGGCRDRLTMRQFSEKTGTPFRALVEKFSDRPAATDDRGGSIPDQAQEDPRWMSGTEAAVPPDRDASTPDEEAP